MTTRTGIDFSALVSVIILRAGFVVRKFVQRTLISFLREKRKERFDRFIGSFFGNEVATL